MKLMSFFLKMLLFFFLKINISTSFLILSSRNKDSKMPSPLQKKVSCHFEKIKKTSILTVLFCLPVYFCLPGCKVYIKHFFFPCRKRLFLHGNVVSIVTVLTNYFDLKSLSKNCRTWYPLRTNTCLKGRVTLYGPANLHSIFSNA